MESVFNIEPEDINIRDKIYSNHYTFFDDVDIPHKEVYYKIVNTLIDYKIKNIYKYIYLKLYKINKIHPKINTIENIKREISPSEFNNIIKGYVGNDILKAIIIMNTIQLYIT